MASLLLPAAWQRVTVVAPARSQRPQPCRPRPRRRAVLAPCAAVSVGQGMTLASFEGKLKQAATPGVLVDFCTAWCGPCKVLEKNMRAIEKAHTGSVEFVRIDTELNPEVADYFGIQKLPTVILFKGSEQVDRFEGLISGQDLDMRLRQHMR